MSYVTEFEGYPLVVLTNDDLSKIDSDRFDFLKSTSGIFASHTSGSKKMFDALGLELTSEYYICVLEDLVSKVGENVIVAMLHHEAGHIKLGHIEKAGKYALENGIESGAISVFDLEAEADQYAIGMVGKERYIRAFRRLITALVVLMAPKGRSVKKGIRRVLSGDDSISRLSAMGAVAGKHYYVG